jgi:PadR family transcriptional regulator, regulatory protein AphA
MNDYVKNKDGRKYIEADKEYIIRSKQDALDLAAICVENNTSLLLLHYGNLTPDFLDLKTRLAGAILQKFINYRIKVAAIIPPEKIAGKFREMVIESNRSNHFRVFATEEEARNWLLKI